MKAIFFDNQLNFVQEIKELTNLVPLYQKKIVPKIGSIKGELGEVDFMEDEGVIFEYELVSHFLNDKKIVGIYQLKRVKKP